MHRNQGAANNLQILANNSSEQVSICTRASDEYRILFQGLNLQTLQGQLGINILEFLFDITVLDESDKLLRILLRHIVTTCDMTYMIFYLPSYIIKGKYCPAPPPPPLLSQVQVTPLDSETG